MASSPATGAIPSNASQVFAGIGFMLLGVSLLPLMNTFAKLLLEAGYAYPQVNWARFTGHLLWMTILFWPREGLIGLFRTRYPSREWLRSGIFFVSNATFIVALAEVPLATASCIMFMTPILVTGLSVPLLGERVGAWRWTAVGIGFLGALVIIRPGLDGFNLAALLVFLSACCFAFYQITTRQLSDEPSGTLIVYTSLAGAIVTSVYLLSASIVDVEWLFGFDSALAERLAPRLPRDPFHWLYFVGVGLIGGLGQLFVIQALKRAPASVISPLGYAELISATSLGFIVFADFPDPLTWLGALLIIASGLLIAYREHFRARRFATPSVIVTRVNMRAEYALMIGGALIWLSAVVCWLALP